METRKELTSTPVEVEYATPPAEADIHRPLPAILLSAPGLLCWALFAGLISRRLPLRVIESFGAELGLLVILAVVTAIGSITFYLFICPRPKPWYVSLNLVINISGLLFIAGVFILAALVSR